MKHLWIRFGCFMTGYNYGILRNCSEAAFKSVKKFTAAMLIVCILWFFIGFTFAHRYLSLGLPGCLLAGILSTVIIVQVEKQIILSLNPSRWLFTSRFVLALIMSFLGAVIIDQILFENDIKNEKISYVSERVDKLLPSKTEELRKQIDAIDIAIARKEAEINSYMGDITKRPMITISNIVKTVKRVPIQTTSSTGRDSTFMKTLDDITVQTMQVPNPKIALSHSLDSIAGIMRQQRTQKENELLLMKPKLEEEMMANTGFLDELTIMARMLSDSKIALFFWVLWILFFLFIEMLVLFSKVGDRSNDYEKAILHHMNLQMRRLDALGKGFE